MVWTFFDDVVVDAEEHDLVLEIGVLQQRQARVQVHALHGAIIHAVPDLHMSIVHVIPGHVGRHDDGQLSL